MKINWCHNCNIPIISGEHTKRCLLCGEEPTYISTDLRPVFPEEQIFIEGLLSKPDIFKGKSVWAAQNRYFLDGKPITVKSSDYVEADADYLRDFIDKNTGKLDYDTFYEYIARFVKANREHLLTIEDEAFEYIGSESKKFPKENIICSFSGGKDSTVVSALTIRATRNPNLIHIFSDTTLELPSTIEYVKRYKESNPLLIFKTARNNEQNFLDVCRDIGPPARNMRWCCTMFKTSPLNRLIDSFFAGSDILTFMGIRKHESIRRSKYNRTEKEDGKIAKQTTASPIFDWLDIDVWLYILSHKIDFNDAYRLGCDRVGCWCCPNTKGRINLLAKIYLPEQSAEWQHFLIDFAKSIGKSDPEEYVKAGQWTLRQGGQGILASKDVKLEFTGCTSEENAKLYKINKPFDSSFYDLFIPFGIINKELGRSLVNEVVVLEPKSKMPYISIQEKSDNTVKIKTMNTSNHEQLQKSIGFQIRKWNACRACLKCESVCRFSAIRIAEGKYFIDSSKCRHCGDCISNQKVEKGCLMYRYLKPKATKEG